MTSHVVTQIAPLFLRLKKMVCISFIIGSIKQFKEWLKQVKLLNIVNVKIKTFPIVRNRMQLKK